MAREKTILLRLHAHIILLYIYICVRIVSSCRKLSRDMFANKFVHRGGIFAKVCLADDSDGFEGVSNPPGRHDDGSWWRTAWTIGLVLACLNKRMFIQNPTPPESSLNSAGRPYLISIGMSLTYARVYNLAMRVRRACTHIILLVREFFRNRTGNLMEFIIESHTRHENRKV